MIRSLIFATALMTVLSAQSPKLFWDGYNWLEIDRLTREYPEFRLPMKRAYVRGLLNGRLYDHLQTRAADSALADSLFSGKRGQVVNPVPTSLRVAGYYAVRKAHGSQRGDYQG